MGGLTGFVMSVRVGLVLAADATSNCLCQQTMVRMDLPEQAFAPVAEFLAPVSSPEILPTA